MLSRGEFVAAALEQQAQRGGLDNIVDTLRKRKLGEKHFQFARQYMQGAIAAAKEKIHGVFRDNADNNPRIPLKDRRLDLYLIYMSVVKDNHKEYIPAIQRISILHDSAVFHDRSLPLRLYAPHLEFRHIQRSAQALEYHNDPFRFGTSFALLLAKAMEGQIPADRHEVPIAIPQPDGMFLGAARRVPPTYYAHATNLFVVHDEKEKNARKAAMQIEWNPTVEITARTYIHKRNFFEGQRKLHHDLMPFFSEPQNLRALSRFVDTYTVGQMDILSLAETNAINAVLGNLKGITQDKLWQQALTPPGRQLSPQRPAGTAHSPDSPKLS